MVRLDTSRTNHFRNGRPKCVATRSIYQILWLKCTKIDYFWLGLCPRSRWGSLQRSPKAHSWKSASYVSEYLCEVKLEEV